MIGTLAPISTTVEGRARLRVTPARVLLSEWTKFRSLRSSLYTVLVAVTLMVGIGALFTAITVNQPGGAVRDTRRDDQFGVGGVAAAHRRGDHHVRRGVLRHSTADAAAANLVDRALRALSSVQHRRRVDRRNLHFGQCSGAVDRVRRS